MLLSLLFSEFFAFPEVPNFLKVKQEPLINKLHEEVVEHLDNNHTYNEVPELVLGVSARWLSVNGIDQRNIRVNDFENENFDSEPVNVLLLMLVVLKLF